ncbi:Pkinase domain-containing protein [Cephalotus follicularis]|uniref:non-specific serine/threonine protein kinase n=1 Tax=Cephalotus follicularis TaxID=3775 RepID=A0A1Q3BPV1_CEPFO|nr:Pkinase domain-containing protein [Cephalotus follicularis]
MTMEESGLGEFQEKPEMDLSLDEPSPRGVLEIPIMGTDSDNSSSCSSCVTNDKSTSSSPTPHKKEVRESHGLPWKTMIDVFKKQSVVRRFSVIPLLSSHELSRKHLRRKLAHLNASGVEVDTGDLPFIKPSWRSFDFDELAAATDNFSPENIIGKGGHAEVYKGKLYDGQVVAVKRIMKNEKEKEVRVSDFLSELGIIAHVNHPNAARLIGFSIDGGLHLVLQFLPQGSLASMLFGSTECPEWEKRYKVTVGIAQGLQYLHHDCHRRIIHRDIKASNILLTEDFEAQISDFGLAKWLPENWPHHVVHPIEGTFGYLAPEYFMHGIVDEKTDVFAFGVLLLEIITGRRAVDSSRQSLVMWAKPLLDSNNVKELADPRLGDAYDLAEMKRAMLTASMCVHHLPTMRPQMNRVLQLLNGEDNHVELKQRSHGRRTFLLDGCDLQDYTCTSYLNDLNRHMELVME